MNQAILTNCQRLLENYPEYRELKNIRRAVWAYWNIYHGVGLTMDYKLWISGDLPQPETISRLFRKVKSEHPELRGSDESRKDQAREEIFIQEQLGYKV